MAEVFDFGLQKHKIKMDGKFFENNLFAVAGDTGRRLEVQLLDSNNMVQNTTGISLRLNANVAGQATYAEATLVDATQGLYKLDFPNGMLIAPGNWQFQWQIIGTSGEKLHSFAFMGSIGSNLSEGGTEATNFYLNVDELKQMQEDLVNGTFNSEVLETNIAEKLTNLETQYAPKLTEVTAKLAKTDETVIGSKNAKNPLSIETYDGIGQAVHPSVVHVPSGLGGYYYWKAMTPYPATNDDYENPSILASTDGINFVVPAGLTNPVDKPTVEQTANGMHMSDPDLIVVDNQLHLFYRLSSTDVAFDWLYHKTSTDGVNWSNRSEIYRSSQNGDYILSPSFVYDGTHYNMWFVNISGEIWHTKSTDFVTWSARTRVIIAYDENSGDHTPWHIAIMRSAGLYYLTINAFDNARTSSRDILIATSIDGMNFLNATVVLKPSVKGWDSGFLYRASLIKVSDNFFMYYSAFNSETNVWGIGVVGGPSFNSMQEVSPNIFIEMQAKALLVEMIRNPNGRPIDFYNTLRVVTDAGKRAKIKLLESGVSGVELVNSVSANTVELLGDDGSSLGNIKLGNLIANNIYTLTGLLNIGSKTRIATDNGIKPSLKLFESGFSGVEITMDTRQNTAVIKADNPNNPGDLVVGNVIVSSSYTAGDVEGAIRYNNVLKKHEGFNGTTWNAMY